MSDFETARAGLLSANILHVIEAARAAGLRFRNGPTKAELVDMLGRNQAMLGAAWAYVQRKQAGHSAPVQDGPAPAPSEPVAPPPAPAAPPTVVVSSAPPAPPTDAAQALASAVQALMAGARASCDPDQVRAIVREEVVPSLDYLNDATKVLRARIEEMEKRPSGLVLHLPNKPEPVTLPGLHHSQFPRMLRALQCALHVYLEGPASSGKTFAAESAAKVLSLPFFAQGAVTYAHELLGYKDAHGVYQRTQFREAFENGGLILLDEFDASAAEAGLVINAALANGFCAFPDGIIPRHENFRCVVGANTDGSGATMQYSGRVRLDGAFLDRFVKLEWQIDPAIETPKARGLSDWLACVRAIRGYMQERQIQDVGATVRAVDFGATLLTAGEGRSAVLEMTCKRGALASEWEAITSLPAVREFLGGF